MYSYDYVISKYIKHINEHIRESNTFQLFYKEASKKQCYPYGVITNIIDNNIRTGHQLSFDVFIWGDDTTKIDDIEKSVNDLVELSDQLLLKDVNATVYVDAIRDADDPDFRLVKKLINITINYF